jgi:hypothetical protein
MHISMHTNAYSLIEKEHLVVERRNRFERVPQKLVAGYKLETQRISTDDLFGIFFVRKTDGTKWDSYYKTIAALRPLLEDKDFSEMVKGFYLNICGDFDSVRISYFVDKANAKKAVSLFKQFFRKNGILEIQDSVPPKKTILARNYGGEEFEERFRNFLVLGTQIGLELINGDLLHARRLFVTYRWQVRKASLSLREHFERSFKKYSPTFNSLSNDEKTQFFTDLEEWPNPLNVDWAHMMVNFVLGCDWNKVLFHPDYLTYGRPLPIPEINKIIKDLGFQIPPDWKP